MYISHSVENDAIVFSLRDRYANIANTSFIASMYYGADPVESITFV
jgi:hypothetical protein